MPDPFYYAHTREDGVSQTVKEHLVGTAELSAHFADSFGQKDWGRVAGLMHDIGKYSPEFQHRLLQGGPKVDHSTAGMKECILRNQGEIAFCIAGHHSGIPNMGGQMDHESTGTMQGRFRRKIPDYSAWKEMESALPAAIKRPEWLNGTPGAEMDLFIRMLYSCLTDADFLDTENFMYSGKTDRGGFQSIDNLFDALHRYTQAWYPPKTELNTQRCRILDQCIRMGDTRNEQGIFSLTVPTGGGKTVASLAFALHHAKKLGLERVIYVIPYTSIIEQTAAEFRKILGNENVLEHHSGVELAVCEEASPESVPLVRAMENWDAPIVVTTAVQFFESIYANRSSKCRKLHNLAKSVIIFDEAQMLPMAHLLPCMSAINQLTEHYHVSAVLCTATQPSLHGILRQLNPTVSVQELCPSGCYQQESFQRVTFRKAGLLAWEEAAQEMRKKQQVLCIVNTRKSAGDLYTLIQGEGSYHLSTLMTPSHRKQTLETIRQRLKDGLPCRVVATSLIEAGVDVDFPFVYREIAGLDSVLQAAGRCNREGKRSAADSIVTVFQSETRIPSLFRLNADLGHAVIRQHEDISSPAAIRDYFDRLMDLKQHLSDLDRSGVMEKMKQCAFAEIAQAFHIIDSETQPIYIPAGDGAALIEQLKAGHRSRELFRQLAQYAVNVYDGHLRALLQAGDVYEISSGLHERFYVLNNLSLYAEETGLSTKADPGKAHIM